MLTVVYFALTKVLAKYAMPVLLILDEWLLLKPNETEQHDILELLHQRRKRSSIIFCSQYEPAGWYDQLGGDESPLAEAILDRIKHDAYKINIVPADASQYRSMREVYEMDPAKSEYFTFNFGDRPSQRLYPLGWRLRRIYKIPVS